MVPEVRNVLRVLRASVVKFSLWEVSPVKEIGIGIVGCGMISEFQADAIGKIPGARVVAFQDSIHDLARTRAAKFGGKVHADFDALARDPEVHAVSICTPSGAHLEPALAAAAAGKHVMVEKPLEVTTERADRIIAACRERKVILGAIFPRRFYDTSLELKRAIDAGRFGAIVLGDVQIKWYRTQEYYDRGGWRGTWKLDGGGALMNQGIHGIDLLQWLMGGIEEVSGFVATRAHERIEVEDVAVAAVRFRSGALGSIEGTTGAWPGTKTRIEISGTKGSAIMEDETILAWRFQEERPEDAEIRRKYGPREGLAGGGAGDPKAIDSEGHRRQFEDFVGAIRDGRPPRIDGAEGRAAVAIITSIYRSARESRPLKI
jgi:UDP-N-acetyl-2-amino-2-deoxyglucuronate dehydrogenase